MLRLKNFVSSILLAFGYSINSKSKKKLLGDLIRLPQGVGLSAVEARKVFRSSKSQLGQDLLALIASGSKKPGFFVEFGSADGVALSNSFLLENELGWSGILCEPSRSWHEDLKRNRYCIVDTRCVYSRTGEQISFSENYIGELSGITEFTGNDHHGLINRTTDSYQVETISLLDLLRHHNAPKHVDFLSVDTEGSEFEILNAFDFSQYTFGAICVEHNYLENRPKVKQLLLANGYRQVYPELSDFDDWFVLSTNQNIPA
jgi:FkbM family methyltransferase